MKFKECKEKFLRSVLIYKSIDTHRFYKSHLDNLYFDELDVENINVKLVEDFIVKQKKLGLTNSTINKRLLALRTCLKSNNYMNIYYSLKNIKLKEVQKSFNYLNYLQVKKLLEYLSNCNLSLENKLIFRLFLDTGIRLSEMVDIKVDNIDLNNNCILLNHTKNGDERYVFFTDNTKNLLLEQMNKCYSNYLIHLTKSSVSTLFNRVNKKLGFKHFSPHVLRHTYATILINNNTNLEFIRSTLGHHSLEITKRYLHFTHEKLFEVYNEKFKIN